MKQLNMAILIVHLPDGLYSERGLHRQVAIFLRVMRQKVETRDKKL